MLIRSLVAVSVLALAACNSEPPAVDAPAGGEGTAPAGDATDEAAVTPASGASDGDRAPPRPTDPTQTHCAQGERAFYNCRFEDGRVVSVCMGTATTYIYGPLGDPELEISVGPDETGVWQGGAVGQGGGQSNHIRFRNGDHDYIVHSGYAGRLADNPNAAWSGVVVLRDGEEVRRLDCPVTNHQTEIPGSMIPDYVPMETDERFDAWW